MQIPSHHASASPFVARPTAATATANDSSSSSSSTSEASITANDFLELLVTEMKNQDPTANTDPNEYINQLVQVNSLQQLIQINQDLGSTSSSAGSAQVSSPVSGGNLSPNIAHPPNLTAAASQVASALEPTQDTSTENATVRFSKNLPSHLLQGLNLQ